jgi:hypothetical protein
MQSMDLESTQRALVDKELVGFRLRVVLFYKEFSNLLVLYPYYAYFDDNTELDFNNTD